MKIGACLAVSLSVLALILVLASFHGIDPDIPKQTRHRFTGYLTWLPELDGFDANELDATLLFNQILLLLSSYYAIKWAYHPPTNRKLITRFYSVGDRDAISIPTIDFDRVLATYIVMTLLAGFTIFLVGVGKIWVAVGVLHNAVEFTILVMLGSGGRIKSAAFWPVLGAYISIITVTCILFKFPYDALWFKGQGLVFDWALIIEFSRVYITTIRELRLGGANRDNLDELVVENEDDPIAHHKSYHAILNHPHQLLLLVVGSVFHVAGNIVFTVYRFSFLALLGFFFSYCITYPCYTYFIYLDLHVTSIYPQKRYYLPENPWWKVVSIAVASIALAFLTIRVGV